MTEKAQTLLDGGLNVAWDDTAMSGTAARTTPAIELGPDIKDVSWNVPWTNTDTVVGAFSVQECNDQTGDALWTSVPSGQVDATTVNDNAGPGMIRARVLGRYARLVYTNVSGTGVLGTAIAQGKKP